MRFDLKFFIEIIILIVVVYIGMIQFIYNWNHPEKTRMQIFQKLPKIILLQEK